MPALPLGDTPAKGAVLLSVRGNPDRPPLRNEGTGCFRCPRPAPGCPEAIPLVWASMAMVRAVRAGMARGLAPWALGMLSDVPLRQQQAARQASL